MVADDYDGPVSVSRARATGGSTDGTRGLETPDGGTIEPFDAQVTGMNASEENVADADESVPEIFATCPSDASAFTHPEIDYAVAELVTNAVEHAELVPAVRINVSMSTDTVEISVRDNCEPIPPEERSAVTDRWEMDDVNHTDGMGLWLVYWVADRSGGGIMFDTHDDENVVTLSLPNADCDETESTADTTGDDS